MHLRILDLVTRRLRHNIRSTVIGWAPVRIPVHLIKSWDADADVHRSRMMLAPPPPNRRNRTLKKERIFMHAHNLSSRRQGKSKTIPHEKARSKYALLYHGPHAKNIQAARSKRISMRIEFKYFPSIFPRPPVIHIYKHALNLSGNRPGASPFEIAYVVFTPHYA